MARAETLRVPGGVGAPPVRVLAVTAVDAATPLPALLHMHGGGYVMGSAGMSEAATRDLAVELGCAIYSVDYRLAPETRFPGAIEDCYAALAWLHRNADALGIDRNAIGLKGESAGGGLAASLALLARDRGEFGIAFQHLSAPMIDDRSCVRADPHPIAGEFVWTPASNRFGWEALLGHAPGIDGVSPYAAAARAADLSGLPPTFISVGDLDLFLEENMEFARRLSRAGVPMELHVYPGAYHGFRMVQTARITQDAERDSKAALRKAFDSARRIR